jgi:multimeric flavodoxin WrbA
MANSHQSQPLRALSLVCTLKQTPSSSSSDVMSEHILDELRSADVECDSVRVVDLNVSPGVEVDMGDSDQWPRIREKILAADILVLSTPTWVGHMSSVAQRVLERLDAELSNTDSEDRPAMVDKVALAAVVGNEDGAHKIVADLFQALNDIGFSIPAQGCTYWNDEAMKGRDFKDLDEVPEAVSSTTQAAARNAIHLASVLRQHRYPPYK